MHVPEGMTEEQVTASIIRAVSSLSDSFQFGYFDAEDMEQEGFIFALECLPKFDPKHESKCSLESYVRNHVRRRFLNLRRNKFKRNAPPCLNCPLFNRDIPSECEEFDDKTECSKWSGWYRRNQAKSSLMESCDVSKVSHTMSESSNSTESGLLSSELFDYVSRRIPLSLRADYRRFVEGAKLNKARQTAVIEAIKEIISGSEHGKEIEAGQGE